ncbi:MAG TPA: mechanosensitive ion channel protein MscS [Persephonella sp.]|uniref:Mechanosensitive ion channel MscS n=1 Tax=Persephonella marina (strain DSM 14350 / EX-H1) TaxID=123214 RepID=C0QPN8_PERMH|nr:MULTISPECIES: mechanosensitive ion channel family protein [Persephonella]ACO04101.1 mechanosensitive ion channel MscS [Persephonella marina EX-H1]HCB69751.1 mechanosensitive ion channel protein MscS [Persephonella sp.]
MENGIVQQIDYLLKQLFLGTPIYKWALALLVFLLFLFFRKLFTHIIIGIIRKLTSRTKTTIDDKLLKVIESPFKFLFIVFGVWFAFSILNVEQEIVNHLIKSLFIITVFWILYNAVIIFQEGFYKFAERFGKDLSRELGSFFIKSAKIFIFVLGFVAVLQEWGIDVTAFIASLGLGGLAFALAAKDTVANLFGGLTILADKSLKIGDWVKVGSVEGIVEDLGIRTTKIRTFEKSLITVPNSYIANNPIENYSRRDNRRIKMTIGLVYDTPGETVKKIVDDIRSMLKEHPRISKDLITLVFFDKFGDSSLDIFIYTFTDTSNWEKYMAIKEDINLKIMEIVERNGSSFAYPSQSIYIEKVPEKLIFYDPDKKD